MNRKTILPSALLLILAAALYVYIWLKGDIAVPPPVDERLNIEAVERQAWGNVADQINSIVIVARGRYALVSTNIDLDNMEVFEKREDRWMRITPNGWQDNIDRQSLMHIGVPFRDANALVNGMRFQWHKLGGGPDVPAPSPF